MKYVRASLATHDAAIGHILVGEIYYVDDDKAERWIQGGIATEAQKPAPQPAPEDPDPDDGDDLGETDAELEAEAKKLSAEGDSQRTIADKLSISRATVRRLLAA